MNTDTMNPNAAKARDDRDAMDSVHDTGSGIVSAGSAPAASALNTFTWLLKREYWEHRGGFLRAPLITALIFLALTLMGLITAEITVHRFSFDFNNMHIQQLAQQISENDIAKVNAGIDIGLLSLGSPIGIVLFFVVFFYLLGALYDDRRDRSVLFWKSLPLSDTQTVLSKVAAAMLIAPALAVGAMMALHVGFLVLLSGYALLHGINPFPLLWSPVHLVALWLKLIALIPLNAIWALPCVGWLLLCSSYARSKPFLWAIAIPTIAGVIVWWIDLMSQLSLPRSWFWEHIAARALFSIFPGSWVKVSTFRELAHFRDGGVDPLSSMLSMNGLRDYFSSMDLWLGAVAGIAMIAASIWFRRKRTEAYA
ncbi:MAG TPA: hypothetical protein VFN13_00445 [Rudaea sp.]|nr:hypothetical protein [Rudaea sp.]